VTDRDGGPNGRIGRLVRIAGGLLAVALVGVVFVRLSVHPLGRLVVVGVAAALAAGVVWLLTRPPAYARWRTGRAARILTARATDGVCVACGGDATGGQHRRFVREAVVLGVPIVVLDDGHNRYCPACLRAERPDETSATDD
jgi:Zn-dependent protease